MPFSLGSRNSSRNSSRNQSSESITDSLIQEMESTENMDVKIYLTDQEIQKLRNEHKENNDISKTLNNTLGRLLVQMTTSHNKSVEKSKNPGEQINVPDLCKAFQETLTIKKEELENAIKTSSTTIKQEIYDRSLNYHMVNPLIKIPDYFSPITTLTTVSKQMDAVKLFPQNKQRFTGEPNKLGPPIAEWIYQMNSAQQKLKLSEEEFKERLLMSTTSYAHRLLRTLIAEQDSISSIYHKLMVMFDFSISPEQAKSELLRFKIHKRSTLIKGQAKILELAAAAARMFPEGELRKSYSNAEACTALIRSLPQDSSTMVASLYNQMISSVADKSKIPLFTELVLYLNPYRNQIDKDIAKNGSSFETLDQQPEHEYRNRSTRERRFTDIPRSQLRVNNLNRTSYNNRSEGMIKNRYMNSLYCSLCGQSNHTAAQGCYKMKDEKGRAVPVTPGQIACSICEKKINKKLYHPIRYCFNKERANFTRLNNQNNRRF